MTRGTQGFTLVETVLAVSITTLVGLAVAGASVALSSATSDGQDYFDCIQGARSTMRQLRAGVQSARLVLGVSNDQTALTSWARDANADGRINLTELAFTQYDAEAKTVTTYTIVFPDTWDPSMLAVYDRAYSLAEMTRSDILNSRFAPDDLYVNARVVGADVEKLAFSLASDGPASGRVRVRMSVRAGDRTITLSESVALRAGAGDYVAKADGGTFALELPSSLVTAP